MVVAVDLTALRRHRRQARAATSRRGIHRAARRWMSVAGPPLLMPGSSWLLRELCGSARRHRFGHRPLRGGGTRRSPRNALHDVHRRAVPRSGRRKRRMGGEIGSKGPSAARFLGDRERQEHDSATAADWMALTDRGVQAGMRRLAGDPDRGRRGRPCCRDHLHAGRLSRRCPSAVLTAIAGEAVYQAADAHAADLLFVEMV